MEHSLNAPSSQTEVFIGLVVDDTLEKRRRLAEAIQLCADTIGMRIQILIFANFEDGILAIEQDGDKVHLACIDYFLNNRHKGTELIAALRKKSSAACIILASAYSPEAFEPLQYEAKKYGANDAITTLLPGGAGNKSTRDIASEIQAIYTAKKQA